MRPSCSMEGIGKGRFVLLRIELSENQYVGIERNGSVCGFRPKPNHADPII